MTREEILAMQPGRELDALVAEKVWDCQIHWEQNEWTDPYPVDERDVIVDHYSTDILAAWEVVEKMQADGWDFSLHYRKRGRKYEACFGSYDSAYVEKAPEAICQAALLTLIEEETP